MLRCRVLAAMFTYSKILHALAAHGYQWGLAAERQRLLDPEGQSTIIANSSAAAKIIGAACSVEPIGCLDDALRSPEVCNHVSIHGLLNEANMPAPAR
jgi:hypothetical protein